MYIYTLNMYYVWLSLTCDASDAPPSARCGYGIKGSKGNDRLNMFP